MQRLQKRRGGLRALAAIAGSCFAVLGSVAVVTPAAFAQNQPFAAPAPLGAASTGVSTRPLASSALLKNATRSDSTDVVYSNTSLTACPVGEKLKYFFYYQDTPEYRGPTWCGAAQADIDWANATDQNTRRIPYRIEQCEAGNYWTYSHAFQDGSRFYSPQYGGISMVCTRELDPPESTPPPPPEPPTPPEPAGPSGPSDPGGCKKSSHTYSGSSTPNPIIPATGDKNKPFSDVIGQGPHALNWSRTYRSLYANSRATSVLPTVGLATGWSHNHSARLQPAGSALNWSDGTAQTLVMGNGDLQRFTYSASTATWQNQNGSKRLQTNASGWLYTDLDADRKL